MTYAAIACSACRHAWAVDLRHASATCPRCRRVAELAHKTRLWHGDDARDAQHAVARLQAGNQAPLPPPPRMERHDSPLDAAAARASGLVNKSSRAEAVARWASRLLGRVSHPDLLDAMQRAGIEPKRAEAEVARMLAMDVLLEPRPGEYRILEG